MSTHQYKLDLLFRPPLYVRQELSILLSKIPSGIKKIVDFGCGTGRLTIPLLKKGYLIQGVDISSQSIEVLKQNIEKIAPEKMKNFSSSSTLPKGQVEAIMGTDILHHVPLKAIVPQFYRTLRPGGIALFSEPNALNIAWYFFMVIFIDWEAEKGVMHCHQSSLRQAFLKSGFKTVIFTPYGIFPPIFFDKIPFLQHINYALARLPVFRLFAYRYILVAQK